MAWRTRLTWLVLLALVAAGLVYVFLPKPIDVEVAQVGRGRFVQTVAEDGMTRVRERYVVSAPVAGTLQRILLKADDPVAAGDVLATIIPNPAPMLDPRTRQELVQRLGAAQAAKMRTAASVERARAQHEQAKADLERTRVLAERSVVSPSRLEHDSLDVTISLRELEAALYEDEMAEHEVASARAALLKATAESADAAPDENEAWQIRAPVAGRVLRVLQESQAAVAIGTPLLEIGDPSDLEVVVDVLSTDAVRIEPGDPVRIEGWGGPVPLEARVRRIEPSAFTKVSALGVDEQRTNIVIDITAPRDQWKGLGDAYRVDAQIVVFEDDDAITVPTGALFREGDSWTTFVVADGIAHKRTVELARRTSEQAAVAAGLQPGETVIVYPSDAVRDGVRVAAR